MTPLAILATVMAYFVVLFLVSALARRNVDNAAFFTGSRQSKWYMVAFAMIGASISGVTYVSVPGMVAQSGFGYLQLVLGFIAGQLIVAFVLTPLFYRLQLTSVYEYLRNRWARMRGGGLFGSNGRWYAHGSPAARAWCFYIVFQALGWPCCSAASVLQRWKWKSTGWWRMSWTWRVRRCWYGWCWRLRRRQAVCMRIGASAWRWINQSRLCLRARRYGLGKNG